MAVTVPHLPLPGVHNLSIDALLLVSGETGWLIVLYIMYVALEPQSSLHYVSHYVGNPSRSHILINAKSVS